VQQKKETQEIGKQIDRYTIINKIETPAQANLLSVVISVKFAQHVITVKQALCNKNKRHKGNGDNSYCYFHFCNYA
jgi:hypothetical protein